LTEIGWTQLRLAKEIGADHTLVCRWIAGTRTPSLEQAFAIERSEVAMPAAEWVDADATGPRQAVTEEDVSRVARG